MPELRVAFDVVCPWCWVAWRQAARLCAFAVAEQLGYRQRILWARLGATGAAGVYLSLWRRATRGPRSVAHLPPHA